MWKPMVDLDVVKQMKKVYAKGGAITSFNQIGSEAPEYLASAGAQRSSPQEYLQSGIESFNAEQNWRKGHQLTGMQKERVAEERGQLQDAAKYLSAGVDLSAPATAQPSYDAPMQPPPPPQEDPEFAPLSFNKRPRRQSGLGMTSLLGMVRGGQVPDLRRGGQISGGPPGIDTVPALIDGQVPAAFTNGEYALPVKTVQQVGKQTLDDLVVRTTGQKPVGYADGGKVSGWNVDRARQIEDAVNNATGVAPPPPAPEQVVLPQKPTESKASMLLRVLTGRKKEYAQGGMVQGYYNGGETKKPVIYWTDPRTAVAVGERPDVVRGAPAVMLDPKYAVPNRSPVMLDPRTAVAVDSRQQWQDPIVNSVPPMSGENMIAAPAQPANPSYVARPVMRAAPIPAEPRTPFADAAASAIRGMSLTADGDPTGNPDVGAPMPMNLEGLRRDMQSAWRGQRFISDGSPTPIPDAGTPVTGQPIASSIVPDLQEQAGRRAADVLRYVGAATRASTPDAGVPVTGQPVGDSILPDLARHGAKAFSNTRLGLQGGAEDAEAAWNRGDWAGAGGHLLRGAAATMLGAGMDAANLGAAALQPLRQAGKTAFTGESTPSRDMTGPGLFGSDVAPTVAAVAPPGQAAPQAAAAPTPDQVALTKNGAMIRVTDPTMQKEFGNAVLTNQSEADTWKGLAGGKKGFLGEVGGAPAGVTDEAYAAMSLPEKSAAKVKSIEASIAAIRSARNARREAEGSPPVGGWARNQGGLAGLKPSEQIAYANLMRGLSNDQRAAVQDDFMNRLRVDERLEGRQKASAVAQDRRMEQAAPFMETMGTDFPGLEGSGPMFFQQTSRLGVDPERAYQTLAGTYEMMRQSTDTKPLFTVAGQDVTPAQAIAILNGETPFDNAWRLQWGGKELYDEIRRMAAQKVQELTLRGLVK